MTTIIVQIGDSAGDPIGGTLTVTLDAPLKVGTATRLPAPVSYEIPATYEGIAVTLDETETDSITYTFSFESTGGDYSIEFHAIVPNTPVTIEFFELIPVGVSTDILPSGIRHLASIIFSNPDYINALKFGLARGLWSPDEAYYPGDIVRYDGSSYIYIRSTPSMDANAPTDSLDKWSLLVERGEPGTGNAGNDEPFNRTGWQSQSDSPTRNVLAESMVSRQDPDTTAYDEDSDTIFTGLDTSLVPKGHLRNHYAPLKSPIFVGDPTAPTKGIGDGTDSIATCRYVLNSIEGISEDFATLDAPTFIGFPSGPSPEDTDISTKLATTEYVNKRQRTYSFAARKTSQPGLASLQWIPVTNYDVGTNAFSWDYNGVFNYTTGIFTPPVNGLYNISMFANFQGDGAVRLSRCIVALEIDGTLFTLADDNGVDISQLLQIGNTVPLNLNQGQTVRMALWRGGTGAVKNTLSSFSAILISEF